MESTTVITRNCAIAAGCARHDANFRADSLRCPEALPAPWCCRSRSAPRSRPVVLPTCCAAGPSTPGRVAPRSRPVTGEALPAPWCCRSRSAPTLPAPRCCPWCCAAGRSCRSCRGAARTGCAGAIVGSLTVLRGSPRKPCAGFRREGIFGTSANFDRPTASNRRRSGRRPSGGDPGGGHRPADLLDSRSLSRRGGVVGNV